MAAVDVDGQYVILDLLQKFLRAGTAVDKRKTDSHCTAVTAATAGLNSKLTAKSFL
ncbi:MAG: hypothetical protein ABSF82_00320 [Candidatus Bathyarchaeia archaeon]|jgi:hypothetical protein